jgi:hypothetical protein
VAQQFRDVDSWIRTSSGKDFGSKEFPRFRNAIRLQLQGLGLITIFRFSTDNVDEEEWALTDKGKIKCALLGGQRRTKSKPNSTAPAPEEAQT